jgi:hypothetical protein
MAIDDSGTQGCQSCQRQLNNDPPWRCDRQSKSDPPADNFPAAQRAAR